LTVPATPSPAAAPSCSSRQVFAREGIVVSYLRLTIGASDLNSVVYEYDDLPPGQTDPDLKKFDLAIW